jgi:hypothetical protein
VVLLLDSVDPVVLQNFLALGQLHQLICMILMQGIYLFLHSLIPLLVLIFHCL